MGVQHKTVTVGQACVHTLQHQPGNKVSCATQGVKRARDDDGAAAGGSEPHAKLAKAKRAPLATLSGGPVPNAIPRRVSN